MFDPSRRTGELAGSLAAARSLAFAIAAALVLVQTAPAMADESGSTVHVRTDAAEGALDSTDGQLLYQVPGREVEYPEPEAAPAAGELITTFALAYVGYPYVAGGNSPYGFDCSGFTQFVVLNVLGVDIGHGIDGQPSMGWWVDYGAWAPGDIVFFQNTYRAGLSHAGIYIGDGLFVHAENEGTGVTISSMYSSYYGPRYWGAIRVG
ncbi:MAG: C40 family peptidase [Thermomicrobiales bacterium]|nr:C40 family peptidase [Thermomicrobiales bacterium]